MNTLVNQAPPTKTISLALHRDLSSGRWYVDQLDVRTDAMRSTTHFMEKTSVDQAFSGRFLAQLKSYFPANLDQRVRSLSTEVICLETVILEGVRILAQSATNTVQRVIIRFNRVIGRIYDILANTHRPDEGYCNQHGTTEAIMHAKARQAALPGNQVHKLEERAFERSSGMTAEDEELARIMTLRGPPSQS